MYKRKTPLSGPQNQHLKLHNAPCNIAQNVLHATYILENDLFPTK